MTAKPGSSSASDPLLQAHAYADGELSVTETLAFETRCARDASLAAESDAILRLRQAIRMMNDSAPMPAVLRERILRSTGITRAPTRPTWPALAASVLLAALLGAAGGYLSDGWRSTDAAEQAIFASHRRALMAPSPIDVASSDRHTVKPWFSGRITPSPRVIDLTPQGYPLVGGRIDVIGRTPVPTLVYRHRQHLISLTQASADVALGSPAQQKLDGYLVIHWTAEGIAYWAISDLSPGDLEAFVRAFRAAPADG